jgi:3-oxoacyl-[acyl-carrier protein] reductase
MAAVRYDFAGRVAVVTGAASGVGLHVAQQLRASNARVSLWDVSAPALEAAARELARAAQPAEGREIDLQQVDVRDYAAVERAARAVQARWGRIDVLANNAGIIRPPSPLAESSLADWADVLAVNLTGVFHCCRAVMPLMAAAGYGRVVNIGSTSGKEGNPFTPSYSAAKAGVMALTKSLGKEFATTGVLVNCISPTVLNTPMTRRNIEIAPARTQALLDKIPMARFGEPDELAAMLLWLASDGCSFSTGAVFDLSGGRATY